MFRYMERTYSWYPVIMLVLSDKSFLLTWSKVVAKVSDILIMHMTPDRVWITLWVTQSCKVFR